MSHFETPPRSGPRVAKLFHRLFALVCLLAWISLALQVDELLSSRGLLPVAEYLERATEHGLDFWRVPTVFWWLRADHVIRAFAWLGVGLSALACLGFSPRVTSAFCTLLYMSFAVAGRDFFAFQWDSLLIECGVLAMLLPEDRASRSVHFLFRVLLFKLYFESGLAKYQSVLHDWHDGSAMTFYYETAPLPTFLGWFAHQLPQSWHYFESRATLFWELAVPVLIFAPRAWRWLPLVALSGFQLLNLATANYGFFCYIALAISAFLLTDGDVERLAKKFAEVGSRTKLPLPSMPVAVRRLTAACSAFCSAPRALCFRLRERGSRIMGKPRRVLGNYSPWLGWSFVAVYLSISLSQAVRVFGKEQNFLGVMAPLEAVIAPFRVVNTYHLFGHITRERIEPEFQTSNGSAWLGHDLKYKPGDPLRRPPFVAPYHPRVDFLLWFYGLGLRTEPRLSYPRTPEYVTRLMARLCREPAAVSDLFAAPLPESPQAVRIVFYRYEFTSSVERAETRAWWRRVELARTRPLACNGFAIGTA